MADNFVNNLLKDKNRFNIDRLKNGDRYFFLTFSNPIIIYNDPKNGYGEVKLLFIRQSYVLWQLFFASNDRAIFLNKLSNDDKEIMKFLFNVNKSNNNTLINMLQYDLNNTRDFNLVVSDAGKTDKILSRNTNDTRDSKDLNKSDIDKYVNNVKISLKDATVLNTTLYKNILIAFNDKNDKLASHYEAKTNKDSIKTFYDEYTRIEKLYVQPAATTDAQFYDLIVANSASYLFPLETPSLNYALCKNPVEYYLRDENERKLSIVVDKNEKEELVLYTLQNGRKTDKIVADLKKLCDQSKANDDNKCIQLVAECTFGDKCKTAFDFNLIKDKFNSLSLDEKVQFYYTIAMACGVKLIFNSEKRRFMYNFEPLFKANEDIPEQLSDANFEFFVRADKELNDWLKRSVALKPDHKVPQIPDKILMPVTLAKIVLPASMNPVPVGLNNGVYYLNNMMGGGDNRLDMNIFSNFINNSLNTVGKTLGESSRNKIDRLINEYNNNNYNLKEQSKLLQYALQVIPYLGKDALIGETSINAYRESIEQINKRQCEISGKLFDCVEKTKKKIEESKRII